jgi:hypothetical protein
VSLNHWVFHEELKYQCIYSDLFVTHAAVFRSGHIVSIPSYYDQLAYNLSLNISYWLTVFDWKCELCFIELYFKMFQLNYTSLNNQVTWKLRKDTWTHGTNFKHDFLINLARIKDICSMERKYHYHVWFKENVVRYLI